ncbi:MAG: hypothetical protein R2798_06895 [Chitinophagales bacterium]
MSSTSGYSIYALNFDPSDPPSPLSVGVTDGDVGTMVGVDVNAIGTPVVGCYNSDLLTDYVCVTVNQITRGNDSRPSSMCGCDECRFDGIGACRTNGRNVVGSDPYERRSEHRSVCIYVHRTINNVYGHSRSDLHNNTLTGCKFHHSRFL